MIADMKNVYEGGAFGGAVVGNVLAVARRSLPATVGIRT